MRFAALVAQLPVTDQIDRNLEQIAAVLAEARPGDLVVLPEGALSGYREDGSSLDRLDPQQIASGLNVLARQARARAVHLWLGTYLCEAGAWSRGSRSRAGRRARYLP